MISKTQAWLLATRPKTLTATLAPVLVGAAVAIKFHPQVDLKLVGCKLPPTSSMTCRTIRKAQMIPIG
jgi:1,4-dihydroxy-2-naphthoate octaprenyltransferase